MSIEARPRTLAEDASCLIVVRAFPGSAIDWSVSGPGILTPLQTVADRNGTASARLEATGEPGQSITVGASYGVPNA
jgi:hypothetical protein